MGATLFQLILHAGSARSFAKEAAEYAENYQWEDAEKSLQQANDEQTQAHKINTTIITKAARGEDVPFSVLLVHSLDLLMLAWAEIDNTEQTIRMNKRIEALEKEVAKCQNPTIEKIAVIGGGSTYTPGIDRRLYPAPNRTCRSMKSALYDIDEERLNVVGGMAQRQVKYAELDTKVTLNLDRPKAVDGAKFVLSSMRIGHMAARILDEKIPLKYNVIGQETTGPGGTFKAFRTIPVDAGHRQGHGEIRAGRLVQSTSPIPPAS